MHAPPQLPQDPVQYGIVRLAMGKTSLNNCGTVCDKYWGMIIVPAAPPLNKILSLFNIMSLHIHIAGVVNGLRRTVMSAFAASDAAADIDAGLAADDSN